MKLHLKESDSVVSFPRFGCSDSAYYIRILKDSYDKDIFKKISISPKDMFFSNIDDFLSYVNATIQSTEEVTYIPKHIEEFDAVDFFSSSSKLLLGWRDGENYIELSVFLYNAPTLLTTFDLDKYGIELK